jgi:hypothetical protein
MSIDGTTNTYTMYNNNTYNSDSKEPGREKSCIRFYGHAKSRLNYGKCDNGNENKNLLVNNTNQSNTMRIANVINTNGLGNSKKTNFGDAYTNRRVLVTYLGTTEGQPGGSGAPPRNKF